MPKLQATTASKISVKIWRPVIGQLDEAMEASCLRRDPFLSKVLAIELPYLQHEVPQPNSPVAKQLIAQHLDRLDRKLVTLTLKSDVIASLNKVCDEKAIVRDAFFNRLFLMLSASPAALDRLFGFRTTVDWRRKVWEDLLKESGDIYQGLVAALDPIAVNVSPFWALRRALPRLNRLQRVGDTVYGRFFEKQIGDADLIGLNCWMPDSSIRESAAAVVPQRKLDDILSRRSK